MASRGAARSIREATRFTSVTPHAISSLSGSTPSTASKLFTYGSTSPSPSPSSYSPSFSSAPPPPRPRKAARIPGETPEERVARLRRAHDAALNAQVGTVEKVIVAGRTLADRAHRVTVVFLMSFSVICLAFTIFAVFDMVRFNRNRRREFEAAIASYEADSLEAARIAYISGVATIDQVAMVDEATRKAEALGFKLPPLLHKPGETTLAAAALGQGSEDKGAIAGISVETAAEKLEDMAKLADTDKSEGTTQKAGEKAEGKNNSWWSRR